LAAVSRNAGDAAGRTRVEKYRVAVSAPTPCACSSENAQLQLRSPLRRNFLELSIRDKRQPAAVRGEDRTVGTLSALDRLALGMIEGSHVQPCPAAAQRKRVR